MKDLWRALIARFVYWLTPKSVKTGICQCLHLRCTHREGKFRCSGNFMPNTEINPTNKLFTCACQFYIPKKDDGGNQSDPQTPSPAELERMFNA